MKKIISLFLALTMCFILCIPTLAYEQTENAAIGIDEFSHWKSRSRNNHFDYF